MLTTSRFALNHIASPGLGLEQFLRLAPSIGAEALRASIRALRE